nr:circularly permuted type 2 ATP-grasp protein [Neiella litorisoli]
MLRDDGATYNIYDEEAAPYRTWQLDLVPSLIDSDSWQPIEAGLLERAELFNLIFKDIYGAKQLIKQGVIPPEVIFGHPGFIRACHGLALPGEHDLILHSADLSLSANGQCCVLADRTQAPSGAGYALENRTVMTRVLPSLFRDSHVHRLAGFFQRLRTKLTNLAPSQEQPCIVLMTPGAHNETYFEHAYLANYLGFHLVQSGDLVVRNGYVWMKSLSGLKRVDVIWRRVDDWYCDPVELKGDSQLGVASLLEVARAGRVAIVNPLGSGVLENAALLRFLPDIGRALLGRDLRLNTVPTYWCGDAKEQSYVLANLSNLVIKRTYQSNSESSVWGGNLTVNEQQELAAKIKANPIYYVGQPLVDAQQIPALTAAGLENRPSILRSFAVASDSSYTLMPGGLTRFASAPEASAGFRITSQSGSHSKDTWVLASEQERKSDVDQQLARSINQADLESLPSRVVENLFWMGRYAERAEASLRYLRTVFITINGDEELSLTCRRNLLAAVTLQTGTAPGFIDCDDSLLLDPEQELLNLVANGYITGSVRANLNAMLICADNSKELLSSDMLRVVNDIHDGVSELDAILSQNAVAGPEELLDPLVTTLLALSGLVQESMIRGVGWRFLEIGRRLERTIQTSQLIQGLVVPEMPEADQSVAIQSLLLSHEVLISYRRLYGARMGVQSSLDLLMLDMSNPRSLSFQLEKLQEHLQALPRQHDTRHELPAEQRAALDASMQIKMTTLTALSARENGRRQQLEKTLSRLNQLLDSVSNFMSDKYFDHREPSQQLVRSVWENRE